MDNQDVSAESTFKEKVSLSKQNFWDNESNKTSSSGSNLISNNHSLAQYVPLFLISFIISVSVSSFVLFHVIGTK